MQRELDVRGLRHGQHPVQEMAEVLPHPLVGRLARRGERCADEVGTVEPRDQRITTSAHGCTGTPNSASVALVSRSLCLHGLRYAS
jgi:hypothetical protein